MKLFLTAIIAFAIGIFVHILIQRMAATSTGSSTSSCQQICMDYSNAGTFNYLNVDLLYGMAQQFKSTSGLVNNRTAINLDDARSVWFDLDSLKRFIWEIESTVCRSACQGKSALNLGVRVYYGRYPVTGSNAQYADIGHLPADYENRHTVFMVPAYDDVNDRNQHIDFDPRYYDASCIPKTLQSVFPVADSVGRRTTPGLVIALSGFNHGSMCPPVCQPGNTYFGN